MTKEFTQNLKEFEDRIKIATNSGASAKEKMLDRLSSEAKKLYKEIASLANLYQVKQKKLEEVLYNIENIDEFMQKKSKKNKKEVIDE